MAFGWGCATACRTRKVGRCGFLCSRADGSGHDLLQRGDANPLLQLDDFGRGDTGVVGLATKRNLRGWAIGAWDRFDPRGLGQMGAALVLLAMFAGVSYSLRGRSVGPKWREWIAAMSVMFSGSVIFAIYAGAAGIRDTIQAGILIAGTTGSHGWFIVPKYGWEIFYYFYRVIRAFVWLLPVILIFWWLSRRNPERWKLERIAVILFTAGLALAAVRGWWRGGIEQFSKESVLAGCWLLGVAWTGWVVRSRADTRVKRTEGREQMMAEGVPSSVLWGLVLTPFLCGIGTNTSIADYAGQGTVFS